MRILSWNVNGIRAAAKKGFAAWLVKEDPDILCVQETKATEEQAPEEIKNIPGYTAYFESAKFRKGYSGTALFTKVLPENIKNGFGVKKFDSEGRIQIADYGKFVLFNIYFPNGKASDERLRFKMDFYAAFLKYAEKPRKSGKKIVICGDVNTAHREMDLARPKENEGLSGFLPQERAWIDKFLSKGYVDTFREYNKEGGNYSWWDMKSGARARNIGWRIDYFYISANLRPALQDAFILDKVQGSDHCPVGIDINL
jgi:exodeoxyribonuclease III